MKAATGLKGILFPSYITLVKHTFDTSCGVIISGRSIATEEQQQQEQEQEEKQHEENGQGLRQPQWQQIEALLLGAKSYEAQHDWDSATKVGHLHISDEYFREQWMARIEAVHEYSYTRVCYVWLSQDAYS